MYCKFPTASGAQASVFIGRVFSLFLCSFVLSLPKVVKRMQARAHPGDAATSNEPHESRISNLEVGHRRPSSVAKRPATFPAVWVPVAGDGKSQLVFGFSRLNCRRSLIFSHRSLCTHCRRGCWGLALSHSIQISIAMSQGEYWNQIDAQVMGWMFSLEFLY